MKEKFAFAPPPKMEKLLAFIDGLRVLEKHLQLSMMKLALAVLVYALMGAVIGFGIYLTVFGKPWFLIGAIIVYVVAFGKIGCLTH